MNVTIGIVRSMLAVANDIERQHGANTDLHLRRVGDSWAIIDGTDDLKLAAEEPQRIKIVGTTRVLFAYLSGRQDGRMVEPAE